MSEPQVTTKAELLAAIERSWSRFDAAFEQLSEDQLQIPTDDQGWTVKDHLVHIGVWERSMVFFLQGKPRHEALGVDQQLYVQGGDDAINAVIMEQRKDLPLAEVLAELRATHRELLALLEPLTDADLQQPYRFYQPNEPGDRYYWDEQPDGPPAIALLYGNAAQHVADHTAWIETLVDRASS
ncbi:MAG TPA: DinB family protein [Herpetosiphonaceae bacterium]